MKDHKPKKVLFVESGEGVGGSAFSLFRVIKYLDKSQYAPEVFVYHRSSAFDQISDLGVPVTVLPIRSPFPTQVLDDDTVYRRIRNFICLYGNLISDCVTNGTRLACHIRRNKISLVHCNNGFFENFSAAFSARLAGVPCISHVRGTEPILRIERAFRRWLSHVIVLNRTMLDAYSTVFGAEKVSLVYNGVDLELFDRHSPDHVRREFGLESQDFCVGTFARVVEGKGIPEFLEAMAGAVQNGCRIRAFVVGDTDQEPEFARTMRELAAEFGLGSRVIFTGWRTDVPDIMSAMDLVLQISTTYPEGMSLAPIEAMALSRAVVVSDNPGYADIVEEGRSGYVVGNGDISTLTEVVTRLANNRDNAVAMGVEARLRVISTFEYGIVVRQVESIYRNQLDA